MNLAEEEGCRRKCQEQDMGFNPNVSTSYVTQDKSQTLFDPQFLCHKTMEVDGLMGFKLCLMDLIALRRLPLRWEGE
jgi:hypothetical protein